MGGYSIRTIQKAMVICLVIAFLSITVLPVPSLAYGSSTKAGDLIAGGGSLAGAKDVGDVYIYNDANNIYVQYKIINPPGEYWCLTESHVEVKSSVAAIPQKNGNPAPGKFTYKMAHNYATDYTYTIPRAGLTNPVYIAVHGVVAVPGGLEYFEIALPSTAQLTFSVNPYPGGPAYLPGLQVTSTGILNGAYNAWCVDTYNKINLDTYNANVYSSYDALPAGIVDKPQNLDLVNWVLNMNFVGKIAGDSYVYTYGDVQVAIWELIDNSPSYSNTYLGIWSPAHVNEIVTTALTEGEGFVPGYGEKLGVILQPVSVPTPRGDFPFIAQVIIIEVPVPYGSGSETCWGAVTSYNTAGALVDFSAPFPGKNWATYLTYTMT